MKKPLFRRIGKEMVDCKNRIYLKRRSANAERFFSMYRVLKRNKTQPKSAEKGGVSGFFDISGGKSLWLAEYPVHNCIDYHEKQPNELPKETGSEKMITGFCRADLLE